MLRKLFRGAPARFRSNRSLRRCCSLYGHASMSLPGQALRPIQHMSPHIRRFSLGRQPRARSLRLSRHRSRHLRRHRLITLHLEPKRHLVARHVRPGGSQWGHYTLQSGHNTAGHSRSVQTNPSITSGKQRHSRQRQHQHPHSQRKRPCQPSSHLRNKVTVQSPCRRTCGRCPRRQQALRRPRLSAGR